MLLELIAERLNYAVVIVLMMTGLYVVFSTGNLVKKLVGLSVFQTSVFLLYISIGKVAGGQPPILELKHGGGHAEEAAHVETVPHTADAPAYVAEIPADEAAAQATSPAGAGEQPGEAAPAPEQTDIASLLPPEEPETIYSNPLPHVLILTAIVVGVATLAVGLALVVRIREVYGSIEDDVISQADYETVAGSA